MAVRLHLDVIDAERTRVSCTSTLGELFGSAVVVRSTGILLNNSITSFERELRPG
jgi:gamma-glutamyltranspeptidase